MIATDEEAITLEELFQVWDSRFLKEYGPLHPRIRFLCESFLRCGDPHFGFLRVRCVNPACHKKEEKLVPFSCHTRGLCSSCGQRRAIEWAERMVEFVLPFRLPPWSLSVPYRQLVFTIPVALRRALYCRRRRVRRAQMPPYLWNGVLRLMKPGTKSRCFRKSTGSRMPAWRSSIRTGGRTTDRRTALRSSSFEVPEGGRARRLRGSSGTSQRVGPMSQPDSPRPI